MEYRGDSPVVVQSDKTVLLEVDNPLYEEARDFLARFAELDKSPEYIHTYRITPLSLWNAAAAGMDAESIVRGLEKYSKYPVPDNVIVDISDAISRYGRLKLVRGKDGVSLLLISDDPILILEVSRHKRMQRYIRRQIDSLTLEVDPSRRGHIKQALVRIGYPAEDLAGYVQGTTLHFRLRSITMEKQPFSLRHYQKEAVEIFWAGGSASGGSGVIVLPCGAGKTMVGMGVMEQAQTNTLVLTTGSVAARQWKRELLDKTTLTEDQIGEYSGQRKEIKPVTLATYQILTSRKRGTKGKGLPLEEEFPHFAIFNEGDWGLIIYDEVHLLPAPVFRITAEIQARRRLGLTATLVREDGLETDVFSLIGPKKYDVPWKDLEREGWIAPAVCYEIRTDMPDDWRMEYALAERRDKYHIAATNPEKLRILRQLVKHHAGDQVLIIGMYLDQLEKVAKMFDAPIITGKTRMREREKLFDQFRHGEIDLLVLSKVGNFSIDLPDANVAIQISGTFGSRQEEAQRLGRILRPKGDGSQAFFYTIVSRDTVDQRYSANRQLFLTEQGYEYHILYSDEIPDELPDVRSGKDNREKVGVR